jgi:circadian clock protein KaiC
MIGRKPTGIRGLDAILDGGIPADRATLVLGGPGAGKTVLAMQMLANAAISGNERGLFVSFEESPEDLIGHLQGFGWGLPRLVADGLISIVDARLGTDSDVTGSIELDGFLCLMAAQAEAMGATRLVLDGIDLLLAMQPDRNRLLQQLFHLARTLRDLKLTTIMTIKMDGLGGSLPVEAAQYIVDCVLALERRLEGDVSVATLRVAKARGTPVITNRFPLAITEAGLELLYQDSSRAHQVFSDRISSGIERLDTMMGGGMYRGTAALISGAPGTAKTTLAGTMVDAVCRRGERALFVSFDEAEDQIVRNLASVSLDLGRHRDAGLLRMVSMRSASASAQQHVHRLRKVAEEFRPAMLVIDPISALVKGGGKVIADSLIEMLVDFVKSEGITAIFTALIEGADPEREVTQTHVSTMADTWLHLTFVAHGGERNRALSVVKSRGSAHSSQVRELILTDRGPTLKDVYSSAGQVLMGTARLERENKDMAEQQRSRFGRQYERIRADAHLGELKARIALLTAEMEVKQAEQMGLDDFDRVMAEREATDVRSVLVSRSADGE